MTDEEILQWVCDSFVESHDFNGPSVSCLLSPSGIIWPELQIQLARLIDARKIDLAFASTSINPHIKRLPDLPASAQISQMAVEGPGGICVYPSSELLRSRPELRQYDDRPYTRRLALAEPQLRAVFFELPVLDRYLRDPRYLCRFGDSDGFISVRDEHYRSEEMAERDKVLLQSFGIGYDRCRNRVLAVFLRYLSDLSAEHQQIWRAQELSEPCTMNSDYARASIWGMWPKHHSVYQAFIQEQIEINKLSAMIGEAPLFKKTFEDYGRPIEFSPMLRPTARAFQEFAHTLDKMLSENMSRDFFRGDISLEEKDVSREGEARVKDLNSITLLQRWLSAKYRDRDGQDKSNEVVQPLRTVRQARQPAAHALSPDEYNASLPGQQDEMVGEVTLTLQKLRLILSSHPKAKGYSPPEWLDEGEIVIY